MRGTDGDTRKRMLDYEMEREKEAIKERKSGEKEKGVDRKGMEREG